MFNVVERIRLDLLESYFSKDINQSLLKKEDNIKY